MLIVGEVHTNVLRERDPVTTDHAGHLLDLLPGEPVLVSERPMSHVRSPEKPVGVDCPVVEGSGRQVRVVGTVLQRATIAGGHVLQGSAYVEVRRAAQNARLGWSHYLARPGVVEALGRARWPELADAFAGGGHAGAELDLGAIAGRVVDDVQRRAVRDTRYQGPLRLRSARTRLRWVAEVGAEPGDPVRFAVRSGDLRVLRLTTATQTAPAQDAGVSRETVERLVAVCEDVALHDWLLTTLVDITRKAGIGVLPRHESLERLVPAIDYLLHLWLPGARGGEVSDLVWAALERRGGFSRQWDTLVRRIRDQLSVAAVTSLAQAVPRQPPGQQPYTNA
ncbi:SCO2521 family protein [Dactylosporangium sp. NBC_01737]|uniref:SCO2521 family protein n=1 Tax=Dactylosporangium sp. NBC_01737 TaxID=2975959 RepID=UPI002E12028C|nr:SCO2521 family protein [Dactylosporangium sp. NBC_01737]